MEDEEKKFIPPRLESLARWHARKLLETQSVTEDALTETMTTYAMEFMDEMVELLGRWLGRSK